MNQRNMPNVTVTHFIVIVIILLSIGFQTAHAGINVWGIKGDVWGKFSSSGKTLYLQGLLDGLVFADSKIQGEEISYTTSREHLIKALDQFYTDYRNELVPVPFALKVISMELAGREKVEIDKQLESLRKQFLDLLKSKAQQGTPADAERPRR